MVLFGQRRLAQILNEPTLAPTSTMVRFSPKKPDSYSPANTVSMAVDIGLGASTAIGTAAVKTRALLATGSPHSALRRVVNSTSGSKDPAILNHSGRTG